MKRLELHILTLLAAAAAVMMTLAGCTATPSEPTPAPTVTVTVTVTEPAPPTICADASQAWKSLLDDTKSTLIDPMALDSFNGRVTDPEWYVSIAAPLSERYVTLDSSISRQCNQEAQK